MFSRWLRNLGPYFRSESLSVFILSWAIGSHNILAPLSLQQIHFLYSAQNLEGAILRDVLLQGVGKGFVVLPIHDAVAVQQKHEE